MFAPVGHPVSDHDHDDESDLRPLQTEANYRPEEKKNPKAHKFALALVFFLTAILLVSIVVWRYRENNPDVHTIATTSSYCLTPACISLTSSLLESMDTSVSPCQDFYLYSCGGWMDVHDIPESKSKWTTFGIMDQKNSKLIRSLLEKTNSAPTTSPLDPTVLKAKTFYETCLDISSIDKLKNTPLLNFWKTFNWTIGVTEGEYLISQQDYDSLAKLLASLAQYDIDPFFALGVTSDDKNSTRQIVTVSQSGLGLAREYYLPESNKTEALHAYQILLSTLFNLTGFTSEESEKIGNEILEFETKLAEINVPMDQMRDPEKIYNNMTVAEFAALTPYLALDKFLSLYYINIPNITFLNDKLNVMTPSYFRGLNDILQNTSKETILRYTQSQLLTSVASHLSQEFRTAVLTFDKVVSGVSAEDPRWQTCLSRTDSALGFALGKLFVDKAFSGNSKAIAESMIQTIVASFKNNLNNLPWMDEPTRQLAREKADAVVYKIGYPDWIQNATLLAKYYENMTITKNGYFQNVLNIRQYAVKKNQAEIYKPVDKNKWEMSPMTVNAYYNPSNNEIVFPAGILQPPFFDQSYPLAYNYGAIGVVMGHELTHGFDDQGSQYDKAGNLRPWWESSVRQNFNERTECISEQYSKYEVITSDDGSERTLVNGNLTLGENIADNGGLKEAYDALETALADMTASAAGSLLGLPALNLTHEQLYFVGFAQIWCSNIRPAAAYLSLQQDPHSPHPYRVIGSVSNSLQFANAFRCPADSPMNPTSKCVVW